MTAPVRIRPILFSTPMIRALLDGRKRQTRRMLKPVKGARWADLEPRTPHASGIGTWMGLPLEKLQPPAWHPGDLLWVRESFQIPCLMDIQYKADQPIRHGHWDGSKGPWRSSIHMNRWASRITLRVTGVKVERLQDISEEDARAEAAPEPKRRKTAHQIALSRTANIGDGYRDDFSAYWVLTHGPGSWEANPWVAAISFDVILANVDKVANSICEVV